MKANKYNKFIITTTPGEKITCKTPSKITLKYANIIAYHHAGVKQDDVVNVEGII